MNNAASVTINTVEISMNQTSKIVKYQKNLLKCLCTNLKQIKYY